MREEETPSVETEKTGVLGNKSTTKVYVKTKITEFFWKYEVRGELPIRLEWIIGESFRENRDKYLEWDGD